MINYDYSDIEILREKIESILEDAEKDDDSADLQINIKFDSSCSISRDSLIEMVDEVLQHHPKYKIKSGYITKIHTP